MSDRLSSAAKRPALIMTRPSQATGTIPARSRNHNRGVSPDSTSPARAIEPINSRHPATVNCSESQIIDHAPTNPPLPATSPPARDGATACRQAHVDDTNRPHPASHCQMGTAGSLRIIRIPREPTAAATSQAPSPNPDRSQNAACAPAAPTKLRTWSFGGWTC